MAELFSKVDPTGPPGWMPPPSDDELVFFLEEPVESDYHRDLANLLIGLLRRHFGRAAYVGGNQAVYYSELQVRNRDFLAPDVFCVKGAHGDASRLGWVVWKEGGKTPDLVVEITSPSTASEDRGRKRQIYEQLLHVREYFIFDPLTGTLEGLRLTEDGFVPIGPDDTGRLRSEVLDGALGTLDGVYQGRDMTWVRVFDADGVAVPLGEELAAVSAERADAEAQRAEAEAQRAEKEAQRAEALAARLAAYEARFGPLTDE